MLKSTVIARLTKRLKQQIASLRRATQFVWQAAPRWTVANLALVFIQGVLPLALLYLTKLIVDTLSLSLDLAPFRISRVRQ